MTIRKGETWGVPGRLPPDGVVVASDAEARSVVESARRAGTPIPPLGVLGGDLCRSLGGRGRVDRLSDGTAYVVVADVVRVTLDGEEHWFVAHLAAHRGWWRGEALVVANASWLGDWNVAPRSHPSDGVVEVTEARVPLGQRRAVARRLRTGDHLPHPGLTTRRVRAATWSFDRPTPVHLDGEFVVRARHLGLTVEPDAVTLVV